MAKLTMIGMYNYDNNLFDGLYVPSVLHKQTVIDSILLRCGEFEVIYSDVNFIKSMIEIISKKWKLSFDKWADLTQLEYNPIHNYDRLEDWTESGSNIVNTTGSTTENNSGQSTDVTTGSDTGQNDNLVTSYDSDTLHQNDRTSTSSSSTVNTSNTNSNSSTSNTTGQSDGTTNVTHTAHLRGNIGITKTTEMIADTADLYTNMNVYELIADVFCEELCVMVY